MFDVFWFRFPLLRPLLALILGIIIQTNCCLNGHLILVLVFLNIGLFFVFKYLIPSFCAAVIPGLFLQINVLLLGIGMIFFKDFQYSNFQKEIEKSSRAFVQIENSQLTSIQSENYIVALYTSAYNNENYSYCGKLLLKRKDNPKLKIGQCFQINVSEIHAFVKTENEYDFDFASFYFRKGIYAALNQQAKITELKTVETKSIQYWIHFFQMYLKEFILNKIQDKDSSAVLLALIDGEDAFISKDLIKAYAALGTLHVLAVSGMHVNLLFGILEVLFLALKRPRFKYPLLLIQLILIWIYALVCGFSPSIIRASLMITFYVFSKAMNRPQSQLNLLINSAFLMLFFQPNLLFDTGFQLSFMAVLGLLVLYDFVFNLFKPKNKFSNAIWTLCAASISAQIACLPLSIYYFHQLPLLFLPANLISIPVCTIAIYWGLVLVCIPFLPNFLWTALSNLLAFNNHQTRYLSKFKYATIDDLYLNQGACILLAIVIALFYMYFKFKSKKAFQIALLLMIVIQFQVIKRNYDLSKQRKVQIYAYGNHPCIAINNGLSALLLADSTILARELFLHAFKLNQNRRIDLYPIHSNFYGLKVGAFFIKYHHSSKTWSMASKYHLKSNQINQKANTFIYMNPKNTAFSLLLY